MNKVELEDLFERAAELLRKTRDFHLTYKYSDSYRMPDGICYILHFDDDKLKFSKEVKYTMGDFDAYIFAKIYLDEGSLDTDILAKIPATADFNTRVLLRIAYQIFNNCEKNILKVYKMQDGVSANCSLKDALDWYSKL